jgi:hypothetical protein
MKNNSIKNKSRSTSTIRPKNSRESNKPKSNINLDEYEDCKNCDVKGENQFSRPSSNNSVKFKKMHQTTLLFSEEDQD